MDMLDFIKWAVSAIGTGGALTFVGWVLKGWIAARRARERQHRTDIKDLRDMMTGLKSDVDFERDARLEAEQRAKAGEQERRAAIFALEDRISTLTQLNANQSAEIVLLRQRGEQSDATIAELRIEIANRDKTIVALQKKLDNLQKQVSALPDADHTKGQN